MARDRNAFATLLVTAGAAVMAGFAATPGASTIGFWVGLGILAVGLAFGLWTFVHRPRTPPADAPPGRSVFDMKGGSLEARNTTVRNFQNLVRSEGTDVSTEETDIS